MEEMPISSPFQSGNFRSPNGAVEAGTTIVFQVEVPRFYGLKEAELVWIHDETNEYDHFRMKWKELKEGRDVFKASVKVPDKGLIWYYFRLKTMTETIFLGKKKSGYGLFHEEPPSWQITVHDPDYTTPDWIKGGVFYHIFVDRFAKEGAAPVKKNAFLRKDWGGLPEYAPNKYGEVVNNDFFGGNIQGIISKLDYLESLGVSCVYISPIFEAFSNHKYDTGDYEKIDEMFGTLEDFHSLCEQAGKRGIRILLDGVFNHTGSDSKYFNKKGTYGSIGAYQSKDSDYYSWYKFSDYPDHYDSWWGIDTLPAVHESDPSFMDYINGDEGIARKWLKEGASGWRLDVADELPDEFLEAFRKAVKSHDEDNLIIGEVWEDASHKIAYGKRRSYFYGQQLDSVMNYPFMYAIIQFIRNGDAENIHEIVTDIWNNYPAATVHCLMNMIGTHDTRRILTALGGELLYEASKEEKSKMSMSDSEKDDALRLLKLASAVQMTLPGVPCIYYGDEAGMEGYEDPLNRRCFPWGHEDGPLLEWYRKLAEIRKGHAVFKKGSYQTLHAENQVYIFLRENESEKLIVGVNRSKLPFDFAMDQLYEDLLEKKQAVNEYTLMPDECCILVHKKVIVESLEE